MMPPKLNMKETIKASRLKAARQRTNLTGLEERLSNMQKANRLAQVTGETVWSEDEIEAVKSNIADILERFGVSNR